MNIFISFKQKNINVTFSHFPVVSLPLFVLVLARCASFPVHDLGHFHIVLLMSLGPLGPKSSAGSISIFIYIYLYLSISIYIYLYLSISIYIYLYLSISIYIYIYLSIYVCVYIYRCIYIRIT